MGSETLLTLLLMVLVIGVFTVFDLLLRWLPFRRSYPHEHYRWPVWNWYAIVVGVGVLLGLAANLYWNARTPQTGPSGFADEHPFELDDILRTSGDDDEKDSEKENDGQDPVDEEVKDDEDQDEQSLSPGPTRLAAQIPNPGGEPGPIPDPLMR